MILKNGVRGFSLIFILVLMVGLSACSMTNIKPVPFSDLTAKQKALWMMAVYNREAQDYKLKATFEDLTEPEKEIMREKKKILEKAWPLIDAYDKLVVGVGVSDKEKEDEILKLLTQLERLLIRKIDF